METLIHIAQTRSGEGGRERGREREREEERERDRDRDRQTDRKGPALRGGANTCYEMLVGQAGFAIRRVTCRSRGLQKECISFSIPEDRLTVFHPSEGMQEGRTTTIPSDKAEL